MPEQKDTDEVEQMATRIPDSFFSELMGMESNHGQFDIRLGLLQNLTPGLRYDETNSPADGDIIGSLENTALISKIAAGPWRSKGGCFDYSEWADRDRFLELDRALELIPSVRRNDEEQCTVSKWIEDIIYV